MTTLATIIAIATYATLATWYFWDDMQPVTSESALDAAEAVAEATRTVRYAGAAWEWTMIAEDVTEAAIRFADHDLVPGERKTVVVDGTRVDVERLDNGLIKAGA
jgi:hypothetical protein